MDKNNSSTTTVKLPSMLSLSKQKGTTAIELAIVAPLFFLLLFVILDGARMIYAYGAVAHAAREGVRYVVVRGTEAGQDLRRISDAPASDTQIESHVLLRVAPLKQIRVTTIWTLNEDDSANKDAGQIVKVQVEHDFLPVTPFLPSITLTSTSSSVIFF